MGHEAAWTETASRPQRHVRACPVGSRLNFLQGSLVRHSPLTWSGQTTGLLNCSWNTNNGLAEAGLAPLCEFSRICGVGAEHNAGRAFSFRSKRKRPDTGIRERPDAPTWPGQPSFVLRWYFRQHLCKLTHNLVYNQSYFNTKTWIRFIGQDGLSIVLAQLRRP